MAAPAKSAGFQAGAFGDVRCLASRYWCRGAVSEAAGEAVPRRRPVLDDVGNAPVEARTFGEIDAALAGRDAARCRRGLPVEAAIPVSFRRVDPLASRICREVPLAEEGLSPLGSATPTPELREAPEACSGTGVEVDRLSIWIKALRAASKSTLRGIDVRAVARQPRGGSQKFGPAAAPLAWTDSNVHIGRAIDLDG